MSEEKVVVEAVDETLLVELDNIDLSSVENIDIDKYFNLLENSSRDKKVLEALEAEKIIEKLSSKYLDDETILSIDKTISNVEDILKLYNTESPYVLSLNSVELDKIFAIVKHFNLNMVKSINGAIYRIVLKREELHLLVNALKDDLVYNGNDALTIGDLDTMIEQWSLLHKQLDKNVPTLVIDLTIKETVLLYQFLSKFEIKGLGKKFSILKSIMNKIKEVNDLFNALNTIKEKTSELFITWTTAINELEKNNSVELSNEVE